MDGLFRYPLFRAHSKQRQAEEKEVNGELASAIKLREEGLDNLKMCLNLTSSLMVKRNIQLQICYEESQLAILYQQETEKAEMLENMRKTLEMRQTEESEHFAGESNEMIDIVEEMGNMLNDTEAKLLLLKDKVQAVSNCHFEQTSISVLHKENKSLGHTNKEDNCVNPVLMQVERMKDTNTKQKELTKKFLTEFCYLQDENMKLKEKIKEMEEKHSSSKSEETVFDKQSPPSLTRHPLGENYVSHPVSVEELVPLENPPLELLKKKFDQFNKLPEI